MKKHELISNQTIVSSHSELWRYASEGLLENRLQTSNTVLAYGPVARLNQFQALLYSEAAEQGIRTLPLSSYELFGRLPIGIPAIYHLHWLHELTKNAANVEEAEMAINEFEALIKRIKTSNAQLIWTVHNLLPHDSRWPQQDRKIHEIVAEASDVIHVMTSDSIDQVSDMYELPKDKTIQTPHPSYESTFDDTPTKKESRETLRFSSHARVVLAFGAILDYKGYDELMIAFDHLWMESRYVILLIAGQPSDGELAKRIKNWASSRPMAKVDIRRIPKERMDIYFKSADLVVCPYRISLNSGVAMMAASHKKLVVGPDFGTFRELSFSGHAKTYHPLEEHGLLKTLVYALENPLEESELKTLPSKYSADKVSASFFLQMTEKMNRNT